MEVALELEDDLFFADLSREIALLIMGEDEDPLACPSESVQAISGTIHPPPQFALVYEQAFSRESKGTGVFIPQVTQPRRKQRKARSTSCTKYQKQAQDTRMVSQVPNKNSFKPRKD